MAFPYSFQALPLSVEHEEKLIELEGESLLIHELPAEDFNIYELPAVNVNSPLQQQPEKKAPRPNKASRAFRHVQFAARQFIHQRRRRADTAPRRDDVDNRLPLSVIELLLAHLNIRGVAEGEEEDGADFIGIRAPTRPCPTSAEELYDRLVYSRDVARRGKSTPLARRLLRSCDPGARPDPACFVTWDELPRLLEPVIAEVTACLGYIEAFRSRLDLETEGCDYWIDLSHLRRCVFRLTGFYPHDTEHDLEAWAFGLPEDLTRLLYPQRGRFDHSQMANNLDEVIVGPAWDSLMKLEAIVCLYRRDCS